MLTLRAVNKRALFTGFHENQQAEQPLQSLLNKNLINIVGNNAGCFLVKIAR